VPQLTDTRSATAARAGSSSAKPDLVTQLADAADTPLVGTAATPDEAVPAPELSRDEPAPQADDAPPVAELLAWVASLPLPPPAAAVAAVSPKVSSPAAPPEAAAVDATSVVPTTPALPTPIETAARRDGAALPAVATPAAPQSASARKAESAGPRGTLPTAADSGPPRVDAVGSWLQALATQRDASGPTGRSSTDHALPLPALPGNVGSPLPRPAEAATPIQGEVHAELGSKEFAPALGAQLSVLVRNGIEHAQLKLNPAEMGPIEVRISIDGPQAQVDFSAAQAHTRQALQEAVPALATALRESGLTLTGGGVFDQPRESRGEAPARDTHAGRATAEHAGDEAPAANVAPRLPRARGVLDLYA
jgi:flagellar hook-length control protein FliK